MSAFLFDVNRMNMSYGEQVDLTKSEKRIHTYTALREWPSAMEQLHLGKLYNSEQGIHLGDKFCKNQQYRTLNVYKKLAIGAKSGSILEEFMEWEGSFDELTKKVSGHSPLFLSNDLDAIEKELVRSAESHYSMKKHRYIMKLLDQSMSSDIFGIQDVQSYSPGYNITCQKYTAMKMDEFLDFVSITNQLERSRMSEWWKKISLSAFT